MELIQTYYGYKIKSNGKYYGGKRAGRVVWVNDYLYGKAYRKETAQRIIERIKGVTG